MARWFTDAPALYLFAGPSLQWPLAPEKLLMLEEAPGYCAWTLTEADGVAPIGHFDLTVRANSARLGRVEIAPECRGRGLANELVLAAIRMARSLGASELSLNVVVGNEAAHRTYRRAGFVELPAADRADLVAMSLEV